MEILSCGSTVSGGKKGELMRSQTSGGNAKTISGILRDKLPMILVILLSWAFQVAGQALPFTEAPPTSEIGLAPALGPEVPTVPEPSPVGDAPQQPAPRPPPAGQLQQFQQVVSSLRVNNYTTGAQYISDYLFVLPLGSTLFVPTNAAFDGMNPFPPGPLLAYHTIMQQLSYQQLILLPVGTQFATMIANNNTVVITSVAPHDFRVDNVRIVQGNICSSSTSAIQISCHGVDGIFNITEWGRASYAQLASVPSPAFDAPISDLIPPTPSVESPSASAPSPHGAPPKSGVASRAERRHTMFSVVFLFVFAFALIV